ncbi:MAG TPA: hypothetical protein VMW38_08390 [Terriglobia bacterium]|nr:hypothetical protein [Terriglobia bacterium]
MKRLIFCLCLLAACGLPASCSRPEPREITYRAIQEGEIWFRNSVIQLRFDSEMYCRVYFDRDNRVRSINDIPIVPSIAKPPYFIEVNGKELKDFEVDYRNLGVSDLRTPLGIGKELHLTGYAKTEDGLTIEKRVSVEFYQDLPDAAIFSVSYRNVEAEKPVHISKVVSNFYRMDAARVHSRSARYAFHYFVGLRSSQPQGPQPVTADFSQVFTTRSSNPDPGKQLPFIDLWTQEMGMAVGDLSSRERVLFLPIMVATDQCVEISMQSRESVDLGPNETLPVTKSFLMVHSGDYQAAWKRYLEVRRTLGSNP